MVLNRILPERHPTDEILRALLIKAEDIVNSRPLTFVSVDIDDTSELPIIFFKGLSNGSKSPGKFTDHDIVTNPMYYLIFVPIKPGLDGVDLLKLRLQKFKLIH